MLALFVEHFKSIAYFNYFASWFWDISSTVFGTQVTWDITVISDLGHKVCNSLWASLPIAIQITWNGLWTHSKSRQMQSWQSKFLLFILVCAFRHTLAVIAFTTKVRLTTEQTISRVYRKVHYQRQPLFRIRRWAFNDNVVECRMMNVNIRFI